MACFFFVYIEEAHATDEWPVACINETVAQHRNADDRSKAADLLQEVCPLHEALTVVLDNEHNDFNAVFACWPFRYWIVHDGKVALKATPSDHVVDLKSLQAWLSDYSSRSSRVS